MTCRKAVIVDPDFVKQSLTARWRLIPVSLHSVIAASSRGWVGASISAVDAAEATARLYPNVLNALAHNGDGLTAVADLVSGLTCLNVRSAQLNITCEMLANYLANP